MIYIIRHGQTELNNAHKLQGRSDQPLNEMGVEQARQAAEKLGSVVFDHVFSSPLTRAVQTAKIVAPGADIAVDERLIEMDYGPYEGADLNHPPQALITFFSDFTHNPAPEGMEQLSEVVARGGRFLESIKDLPGNILVSTHAIAMKGLLEYLTPDSGGSYWSKHIGNCAVYVTRNEGGKLGVPERFIE